jgi:hypothetical protein
LLGEWIGGLSVADERQGRLTYENFLMDPMIRLMMASDGVSEAEMAAVLKTARAALRRREQPPLETEPA